MRDCQKNLQTIYYRFPGESVEVVDLNGNRTGSRVPTVSELKSARLCVSPSRGTSSVERFGTELVYNRVMTTSDTECEIDETALLWIENDPDAEKHDYVVAAVSRWKNSVSYAIRRVDVS